MHQLIKRLRMRWGISGISLALIIVAVALMCYGHAAPTATKTAGAPWAALLNVDGAIGPAVQDYLERGLVQARHEGARIVVIQMDTPGGLSKSMRGIIQAILTSSIPVVAYVAPSGARAASAGTYILYASHIAAMAPGTNLGAATPVSMGQPGDKNNDKKSKANTASERKALNDARAYIRSLAQLRGRNVVWAEKAVTEAATLSANEALKENVIDLIATSIPDLLKKIDGRTVMLQGNKQIIASDNLAVRSIQPDWRTRFLSVITDPSIAYILLMIGFYGLFFEFANPGFILPGVAGAICMLLALYALQLLPINYAGLGLILLGMAFIIAEVFMPSFGALGIGGIISFAVGSILLLKTESGLYAIPLQIIIAVSVVTLLFFIGVLQLAIRSRRRRVVSGREALIGQQGKVMKDATGRYWIKLGGELWQYHCDTPLTIGQRVVVIGMKGLVLDVAMCDDTASSE